ncbi:MAG: tetratricopeptide repeat protein [bacterium]|nr:tetratricopeptide repeat protein [bacterium]
MAAVLLQPTTADQHYDTLAASTVSAALVESRGSCAALTALVLSLTEPMGDPFEAVVMKDHVLLGSSADPDAFFELLKEGEPIDEAVVLSQPQPPGGPLRLSGPEFLPYYLDNLAARLADTGEPDRATALFERALKLAPEAGRIHFNYGTFLTQIGRDAAAEQHLSMAIELGWIDVDAFVNRGVARWNLGKTEVAALDFEAALELRPDDLRAAENLRRLRNETPRPEEVEAHSQDP